MIEYNAGTEMESAFSIAAGLLRPRSSGTAAQGAFFDGGTVSMMERIATANLKTLNMRAIIAAARSAGSS